MVSRIGTLEIGTRIDSAGVTRGITAVSSAVSGFADGFRLATDAIQRLNMVSEELAQSQAIARGFNLSRESYERFALSVSSSLGDIGEARDLLSDFQEAVSLLGRGEEREVELFRELGFDIEFAKQAQEDLTGSFDIFLQRIRQLDQVAARGVLTELIGGDASRQVNQLAQSYGRFADALGRPLVFATDDAVDSLNNLRVASEAAGTQLRESIVQALGDSGLSDALAELITDVTNLNTVLDPFGLVFEIMADDITRVNHALVQLTLWLDTVVEAFIGFALHTSPAIGRFFDANALADAVLTEEERAALVARLSEIKRTLEGLGDVEINPTGITQTVLSNIEAHAAAANGALDGTSTELGLSLIHI